MRYFNLLIEKLTGSIPDMVQFKKRYPRRKLTEDEVFRLKDIIGHRLDTEDYRCRLPKVPKPRVRYQLRTLHCIFIRPVVDGEMLPPGTYWV